MSDAEDPPPLQNVPPRIAPKKGLRSMVMYLMHLRQKAVVSPLCEDILKRNGIDPSTFPRARGYSGTAPAWPETIVTLTPEDVEALDDIADVLDRLANQLEFDRTRGGRGR